MEHIRINGTYWGLTTLDLLGKIGAKDAEEGKIGAKHAEEVVSWVLKCQHESGL